MALLQLVSTEPDELQHNSTQLLIYVSQTVLQAAGELDLSASEMRSLLHALNAGLSAADTSQAQETRRRHRQRQRHLAESSSSSSISEIQQTHTQRGNNLSNNQGVFLSRQRHFTEGSRSDTTSWQRQRQRNLAKNSNINNNTNSTSTNDDDSVLLTLNNTQTVRDTELLLLHYSRNLASYMVSGQDDVSEVFEAFRLRVRMLSSSSNVDGEDNTQFSAQGVGVDTIAAPSTHYETVNSIAPSQIRLSITGGGGGSSVGTNIASTLVAMQSKAYSSNGAFKSDPLKVVLSPHPCPNVTTAINGPLLCAVLCCIVLSCAVLCCVVLYCPVLRSIVVWILKLI
jgi:hypothetical protein